MTVSVTEKEDKRKEKKRKKTIPVFLRSEEGKAYTVNVNIVVTQETLYFT